MLQIVECIKRTMDEKQKRFYVLYFQKVQYDVDSILYNNDICYVAKL